MNYFPIFFIFNFLFLVSTALECKINDNDPLKVAVIITVSKNGDGNFATIGEAISSIPSGNDQWIRIFIKDEIYTEKIEIPDDKECIVLHGSVAENVIITYDDHAPTFLSATFSVNADNFVAKGITFKNSYNRELAISNPASIVQEGRVLQAVAFRSYGDRHAFYKCRFEGYQDTVEDARGRHYFNFCYIEGAVDFIFGGGQSVYEPCLINATGGGFITAQQRNSATDPSGFLFNWCHISGKGMVKLGRAWGPFSRVIFTNSNFDNVITPEGWDIWRQQGHEGDVTYVEQNCKGPGADTSRRVPWAKRLLSGPEVDQYTTNAFINQDGWIDRLPCLTC